MIPKKQWRCPVSPAFPFMSAKNLNLRPVSRLRRQEILDKGLDIVEANTGRYNVGFLPAKKAGSPIQGARNGFMGILRDTWICTDLFSNARINNLTV